jgi:polyisoprenoid-binding protein YceI
MVRKMLALAVAALFAAPVLAGEIKLTGENTKVEFVGSKKAGKHTGGFKTVAGKATTDAGTLKTLEVTIETDSIFSDNEKLTTHLKAPDFFNVKEHPKAMFTITKVDGKTITGELTMLGKKGEVTFPAEVEAKDGSLKLTSEFKIDRTKWGMTYGKGMIDDEVVIKVSVDAK